MSDDLTALEIELRALRPAALDDVFVERLEQCAEGSWDFTSPLELSMEHQLRSDPPMALDPDMTERLLAEVMDLPFPETPTKILPFPATVAADAAKEKSHRGGRWLAAAAAVALMGALAGWFVPQGSRGNAPLASESRAAGQNASPAPAAVPAPSGLVPAGMNRGLSEATDEGVILHGNNRPHRVLKFVYREQVTLKDAQGRTYQVEQPRVEYLIVPAKTD